MNRTYLICLLSVLLLSCKPTDTPTPTPVEPEDTTHYVTANTTVVYECNERLFARQNAFKKIQDYLPVLQEMQVNVLWLMPIHPRGTVKSVGSPYCVKNYLTVDPAFGTLDDFKALVDDAHSRGMLVMLDWVANHTAWDNPWYTTHPEWYTTPEGDETGWNDIAPLDYSQRAVCDTMCNVMLHWVQNYGVDGFRCDYAHGVPTALWDSAITVLRQTKPDIIMLAETSKTAYYRAGFDWLYSWDYLGSIQKLFKEGKKVASLLSTNRTEYASSPKGKERLRYITTHDASSENAPSTFYKTASGELAASCLTFFLGGVPMIYSSQEIGYLQKINFFDYKILSFDSSNATTVRWKELMRAYIATAAERAGEFTNHSTESEAIFTYQQGKKEMLVAVNCQNCPAQISIPEAFANATVTDALNGATLQLDATLALDAYGYVIYTK